MKSLFYTLSVYQWYRRYFQSCTNILKGIVAASRLQGLTAWLAGLPSDLLWRAVGGFPGSRRIRSIWSAALLREWRRGNHAWFDHRIDELNWPRNVFWVERGILGRQHLPKDAYVLGLFCGDRYFSDVFWADTARRIDAVDRDADVLFIARTWHHRPNILYHQVDVSREPSPSNNYDLVCFFEGIEHLSASVDLQVLGKIHLALKPSGWLVGSTPLVQGGLKKLGNREHDNEFDNPTALRDFVSQAFGEVEVFETYHPQRITLYFKARKWDDVQFPSGNFRHNRPER